MKLFGSGGGGKHSSGDCDAEEISRRSRLVRVLAIVLVAAVVFAAAAYTYYRTVVKPPTVSPTKRTAPIHGKGTSADGSGTAVPGGERETDGGSGTGNAGDETRDVLKYTFLVLGCDDGNGNMDTIMVATFDATNYTMDIVSIPRDTMMNVPWYVKKANTLYSYSGIEGTMDYLSDILGYELDFYLIVDLEAFEILVDAIGGVDYDVPVDMDYEDKYQDLYIHIPAGYQHLSGEDAMKVVRYRSGYTNADIGRISTQQDFLMTVAAQILENRESVSVTSLINVVANYVESDLTYGNLLWFAREFMKIGLERISFHTVPGNYDDHVMQAGEAVSYVSIYTDEWIEMINAYLNPFAEPVTREDLSILTRDSDGSIYATDGEYEGSPSWGN